MSATKKDVLKPAIIKKNFDQAEEIRPIDKGKIEVINIKGQTVMRAIFQPGWRWSSSVKPVAGTDSCEVEHLGYMVAGRMIVKMNDGMETELKLGDFVEIPAGHDAWVVGDEPVIFIDFQGGRIYARSQKI